MKIGRVKSDEFLFSIEERVISCTIRGFLASKERINKKEMETGKRKNLKLDKMGNPSEISRKTIQLLSTLM